MTSKSSKNTSRATSGAPADSSAAQAASTANARKRSAGAIAVAIIAVIAIIGLVIALVLAANHKDPAIASANSAGDLTDKVHLVSAQKGKEPKISIKTPVKVDSQLAYRRLQDGTGRQIKKNDLMCINMAGYNAKTGQKLISSWTQHSPDCSIVHGNERQPMRTLFDDARVGSIWALSTPAEQGTTTSSSANAQGASIWVLQIMSAKQVAARARGTVVKDVPSDLPKVTRDATGKPSITMNGYKGDGKLVSQYLIKGTGPAVKAHQTVRVQYTGWLLNGKKFDSSWDRGSAASFSLDQVVKGWSQGLVGKKVGSQVMIIVPPSLGYGSTKQGSIPANSTLVFVVDILDAQ